MSRPLPSWHRLAEAAPVRVCRGIRSDGSYCRSFDHLAGASEPGVVHWADRQPRWPSITRFVKLAAYAGDPALREDPLDWRRIYLVNMAMRDICRRAGIRIPAKCLRHDRLMVRSYLVGVPSDEPYRKAAFDWSRRGAFPVPPASESELRAIWGDR